MKRWITFKEFYSVLSKHVAVALSVQVNMNSMLEFSRQFQWLGAAKQPSGELSVRRAGTFPRMQWF